MRITCPSCGAEYPIEAGFLEDDGKRLAAMLAELEPALARAALAYLRLWKPAKTVLRTVRAVKLLQELLGLVRAGSVCRDERGGLHRPCTPALWIAGIEQMVNQGTKIETPLSSHVYLRKIVFGMADAADAAAERQRNETERRNPRSVSAGSSEGPASLQRSLDSQLSTLRLRRELGRITQDEYDRAVDEARRQHAEGLADG